MKIEQYIRENLEFFQKNEAPRYSQNFIVRAGRIFIFPLIAIANIIKGIRKNPPKFKNIKDIFAFIAVLAILLCVSYAFGSFIFYKIDRFFTLPNPFKIIASIYIGSIIFGIIFTWQDFHGLRGKIVKKYLQGGTTPLHFDERTIMKAAAVLQEFTPSSYAKAVERHGELTVDLLLITNCIGKGFKTNQLRKIVSLKALEEDREATAEDDE